MAKNTQIKARNANSEIHLSHSQIDSPLLDYKATLSVAFLLEKICQINLLTK